MQKGGIFLQAIFMSLVMNCLFSTAQAQHFATRFRPVIVLKAKPSYCSSKPLQDFMYYYGGKFQNFSQIGQDELRQISVVRKKALHLALVCSSAFMICFCILLLALYSKVFKGRLRTAGVGIVALAWLLLSISLQASYLSSAENILLAGSQFNSKLKPEKIHSQKNIALLWNYLLHTEQEVYSMRRSYHRIALLLPKSEHWYLFGWDQVMLVDYEFAAADRFFSYYKTLALGADRLDQIVKSNCVL